MFEILDTGALVYFRFGNGDHLSVRCQWSDQNHVVAWNIRRNRTSPTSWEPQDRRNLSVFADRPSPSAPFNRSTCPEKCAGSSGCRVGRGMGARTGRLGVRGEVAWSH